VKKSKKKKSRGHQCDGMMSLRRLGNGTVPDFALDITQPRLQKEAAAAAATRSNRRATIAA